MNRYPLWKYLLVVFAILMGLLYSVPNLFGEAPAVQVSLTKNVTQLDAKAMQAVEDALKQAGISYDAVMMDKTGIKVRFADTDTQIKAQDALKNALGKDYVVALNLISRSPSWLSSMGAKPMYLGLDLRGGVHFLLQV
ncbi:MAG: protein translocase subunit SecD, partial [Candidatus Methylopumilus sp.]|nr:protein translocase subunit SecD [Candidatus Methylopumilus sp.]